MNLIHIIGQKEYAELLKAGMPTSTQPVSAQAMIIQGVLVSRVTFTVTPEVFEAFNEEVVELKPLIKHRTYE